jgi:hypothetical protein
MWAFSRLALRNGGPKVAPGFRPRMALVRGPLGPRSQT